MNKSRHICPVCDEGTLTKNTHEIQVNYKNRLITVTDLEGHLCDACDARPISPQQIHRNHRKIADVKRSHDGLLTSAEIKNIRKNLGLTQRKASVAFGGGVNAFSKYERGDVIQSEPMDKLLRVAADCPQAQVQLLGQPQYKHTSLERSATAE